MQREEMRFGSDESEQRLWDLAREFANLLREFMNDECYIIGGDLYSGLLTVVKRLYCIIGTEYYICSLDFEICSRYKIARYFFPFLGFSALGLLSFCGTLHFMEVMHCSISCISLSMMSLLILSSTPFLDCLSKVSPDMIDLVGTTIIGLVDSAVIKQCPYVQYLST